MTERRNPGCAFGPCNDSAQVGGDGCHLCDDIATLPQRGRGVVIEDEPITAEGDSSDASLKLSSEAPAKKAKKVGATRKSSKRSTSGGLFS